MEETSAEELNLRGCKNLLAKLLTNAMRDAQSDDESRAYYNRRWLRENADWVEYLDVRAECVIDWVDKLQPLQQATFW